ncbi:hypothetical protein SARC_04632 [Sphaeroforma arctica JP610]|uniref:1-phosphatidylinositol 4-kinase n=1 Tax=Sphaeroforma arctica JP610 TaxID=667725 RepID=A0A0L0G4F9_9EUKA|nr:hypothetical protein, variant [Sphaeroforma arctica JP610]XP_014156996.1 hypothetical protein SARC_04632 [Sphaeroforma arctica JP610]KNC83093.1 hypothetical protein, variant [Sphaeroforma arctica JP610]KNC83094.1 hypothetical protein SARC_04632 [Sphaeroforma arctica JP610]|eukprot:XP_014156995.1 hypothetical protein, variant [Sphaeroforma arctica JP610]
MGIHPTLIRQGSSGSYFVRNPEAKITGVFKPKDEEPYGHLNPKWTKWLHKTICPCIFGRSCLVPNQGYLSEAGASLVDEKLGLRIVPTTKVVKLSSPVFNYPRTTRLYRLLKSDQSLPYKKGSLQLFVTGYEDAKKVFGRVNAPDYRDHEVKREFDMLFERMVVLDYITRNTDRNDDNWLIKTLNDSGSNAPESDLGVDLCTGISPVTTAPHTNTRTQASPKQMPNNANSSGSNLPSSTNTPRQLGRSSLSGSLNVNGPVAYHRRSPSAHETSISAPEPLGSSNLGQGIGGQSLYTGSSASNKGSGLELHDIQRSTELPECHRVKLAAIDNGLSFPFKHPDSWRTYPYHWIWLPQAKKRFSDEICNYLLPLLTDEVYVEELIEEMYQVFKQDSGFSKSHFKRQAAVMRGQILNLTKAMNERSTPIQLVKMTSCVIKKKGQSKFQQFRSRLPWFSNW